MSIFPIEPLRQAFLAIPEQQYQSGDKPIDMQYFYVPASHTRALHPDNMLVEGIRGSGKSEWWIELQDSERLKLAADLSPRTELSNIQCSAGFGQTPSDNYPNKRTLAQLLKKNRCSNHLVFYCCMECFKRRAFRYFKRFNMARKN